MCIRKHTYIYTYGYTKCQIYMPSHRHNYGCTNLTNIRTYQYSHFISFSIIQTAQYVDTAYRNRFISGFISFPSYPKTETNRFDPTLTSNDKPTLSYYHKCSICNAAVTILEIYLWAYCMLIFPFVDDSFHFYKSHEIKTTKHFCLPNVNTFNSYFL